MAKRKDTAKALYRALETRGWIRNRYGAIMADKADGTLLRVRVDQASFVVDNKKADEEGKLKWFPLAKVGIDKVTVNEKTGEVTGLEKIELKKESA